MTITTELAKEFTYNHIREDLRYSYNYAAVADDANDAFAEYGIAEYEVPPHHSATGNAFVVRF